MEERVIQVNFGSGSIIFSNVAESYFTLYNNVVFYCIFRVATDHVSYYKSIFISHFKHKTVYIFKGKKCFFPLTNNVILSHNDVERRGVGG